MRAFAIHAAEDLRVDEVTVPEPGPDQVRLKVAFVGVCGSDLHYYFHGRNGEYTVTEPLVFGHELSATVDLDPRGEYAFGTPVTVHPARFGPDAPGLADAPHLRPGGDYLGSAAVTPHRQGAASDYLVVERDMIRVLPAGLSLERAALAEPLGVALHAIARAGDVAGKRVLVIGAGPIGLLAVAALKTADAVEIAASDLRPEPLARAQALGARTTYRVGEDEIPNEAYDVVLECSGAGPALTQAVRAVARLGTVVQVGMLPNADIPVNLAPLLGKEVTIRGAFRFRDEIDRAIELLAASDAFDAVITHVVPADEVVAAFETARDSSASAKVLIAL